MISFYSITLISLISFESLTSECSKTAKIIQLQKLKSKDKSKNSLFKINEIIKLKSGIYSQRGVWCFQPTARYTIRVSSHKKYQLYMILLDIHYTVQYY